MGVYCVLVELDKILSLPEFFPGIIRISALTFLSALPTSIVDWTVGFSIDARRTGGVVNILAATEENTVPLVRVKGPKVTIQIVSAPLDAIVIIANFQAPTTMSIHSPGFHKL